jgi:hypothetical protein
MRAPGSDRKSHRDLPMPCESTRQQQIGNVRAADQHEHQSRGHQQKERPFLATPTVLSRRRFRGSVRSRFITGNS